MKERFVLFQSSQNDEYYWHLKAPNHEIILQSEGYKSKVGSQNGIASVKEHSPFDKNYERLDSKNGQFYFRLKADNGKVIGVGETYTNQQNREVGIAAVKKYAPSAPIVDMTKETAAAKAISATESANGLSISSSMGSTLGVTAKGGYYGCTK